MTAPAAGKRDAVEMVQRIEKRILMIRGHKVVLDADLATLYGVRTKRLNEQVKRNTERFPEDFIFQLTEDEAESLRSQIATSNKSRGGIVPTRLPNTGPSWLPMCSTVRAPST